MPYTKEYRAKNLKRIREANKKWNNDNIEKHREANSKWYKENTNLTYSRQLKKLYGITLEQYNQMFVNQNGLCKICGISENKGKRLCVDHCHSTGKVRGLICYSCNSGLGFFKDNIKFLQDAIKYLKDS